MENSTCIQPHTLRKISDVSFYFQLLLLNWGLKKKLQNKRADGNPRRADEGLPRVTEVKQSQIFLSAPKRRRFGSEIRSWAVTPNYAPTWDESFSSILPASVNNKRKEKHNRNFSKYIEQNQRQPYNLQALEGKSTGKRNNTGEMGDATQQFCITKVNVVCKMKVIFLLLLIRVFFVLMEGKGQTYTKETSPDYSEVRVQAFIVSVSVNKTASWANWKVMPGSRLLVYSSLTPRGALLGRMSVMGWEGNKSFQRLLRNERI